MGMKVDSGTVRAALNRHRELYATRKNNAWDIKHHIGLWMAGLQAFRAGSREHFEEIYKQLRNRWQVFRGGGKTKLSAGEIFQLMGKCDKRYQDLRLSQLTVEDLPGLWCLLLSMGGIKVNSDGPAIVAISKFLHFWNPALFVIVDHAVMWNWVFRHQWLRYPMLEVRRELEGKLPEIAKTRVGPNCDLGSYLAILVWAGRLLAANSIVMDEFRTYLDREAEGLRLPNSLQLEAVAVEWFLLGLVELPAAGVVVGS